MWFGTKDYAQFIDAPLSGGESSPEGWGEDGIYIGGDAYVTNSYNTHKTYNYAWPSSSSREMAQLMQSFRSGTFGRGKLFWVEPTSYDMNVLPAKWADPSITLDYEGPSLVPFTIPASTVTSGQSNLRLPVKSAQYDLSSAGTLVMSDSNAVFVPIPDGMQLNVGAFYSSSIVNAGVYFQPAGSAGTPVGTLTRIEPLSNSGPTMFNTVITKPSGQIGAYIAIGKTEAVAADVTVAAIHARLSPTGVVPDGPEHWVGGQGHAGCRFVGSPTYVTINGVGGGQIEYAATFKEVLN